MLYSPSTHTRQLPPYNVITDMPELSNQTHVNNMLTCFKISMPMLINYVLSIWPMIAAQMDDIVYEHVAEEIMSGCGIFQMPQTNPPYHETALYFQNFEALIDTIFKIRDHFIVVLRNAVNVSDEADATQLMCRAYEPGMVVIRVQPEYEL